MQRTKQPSMPRISKGAGRVIMPKMDTYLASLEVTASAARSTCSARTISCELQAPSVGPWQHAQAILALLLVMSDRIATMKHRERAQPHGSFGLARIRSTYLLWPDHLVSTEGTVQHIETL